VIGNSNATCPYAVLDVTTDMPPFYNVLAGPGYFSFVSRDHWERNVAAILTNQLAIRNPEDLRVREWAPKLKLSWAPPNVIEGVALSVGTS